MYIIYGLVIMGMILTLYIIYTDLDAVLASGFVVGYAIFLVLSFIYFVIVTFLRLKNLDGISVKKRMFKFLIYFVVLSGLNYLVYLGFKPAEMDLYKVFPLPLGLSIGLSFLDLMFFEEKGT